MNFDLTTAVNSGDTLDFVVDRGVDGGWDCDSTFFDPTIVVSASAPVPANAHDVNGDGSVTIADVQLAVNQALMLASCGSGDVNGDRACTVSDVQLIINGVLGL